MGGPFLVLVWLGGGTGASVLTVPWGGETHVLFIFTGVLYYRRMYTLVSSGGECSSAAKGLVERLRIGLILML